MNASRPPRLSLPPRPLPAEMLTQLQARFGAQLSTAAAVRQQHGRDESPFDVPPPDAVLFCQSTEDVAEAVRLAAQHKIPVIPCGAGSSLEGQLLAVQGGLSLDLSRMSEVLALQPEDLTVTVQAGVLRSQLNQAVRHAGLFFPIDPGADASIGSMTATRASGTNAVRYGTMRENVLGLTVVTAQGEVIRTGTRARKSSAGYDLTRLLVGSEGTLGVITEITLRLHPLPEHVAAATGLPHAAVGHVGDGNFHMIYLIDPARPDEREVVEQLNERLVCRAIANGGTCTGEHGIGLHKQGFLLEEAGVGGVAMMRALKAALDPHQILNPGKIFQA